MPINAEDVIELLCILVDEENLKVSVKESLKGGVITGCTTVVGGLLGGPVGMAIGGATGGAAAAYISWGKFEPVSCALQKFTSKQKQELYELSMKIITGLTIEDAVSLNSIVLGDAILRQQILDQVVDHLKSKVQMEILD